jgi:hypothetical protein
MADVIVLDRTLRPRVFDEMAIDIARAPSISLCKSWSKPD